MKITEEWIAERRAVVAEALLWIEYDSVAEKQRVRDALNDLCDAALYGEAVSPTTGTAA